MIGIYCRVSTQQQVDEGHSLETQRMLCLERAYQLGYSDKTINFYIEEGKSGEDIDRPQLNALREDIINGQIKKVIITDPDRLTRDLTDKLIICKEWDRYQIEIIFIDTDYENTPEGQMFFNMRSVFAQYELAQIRKRTVRGRLRAVEKEKKVMPMRAAPYGYEYKDGKLVINDQEAAFVSKIYEWYIEGKTLREIGTNLYKLGAIPKRKESKNFSASSIQRILTSPVYIGKYTYNKRASKKVWGEKTATGKQRKTYSIRDEEYWITIEVPSIVNEQIYELAQRQRKKNTRKKGNNKSLYLFKGLIRCSHCGRIWECTSYSGRLDKEKGERKRYPVYRCPNLNPKRYGEGVNKCSSHTIRADLLEEFILKLIQETFADYSLLEQNIEKQSLNQNEYAQEELESLQKQLHQKLNSRERIKSMYVKEVITEEEMLKDMKKVNQEANELKLRIDEMKKNLERQKTSLTKADLADIVNGIKSLFQECLFTFEDKQKLVDLLIDEIRIDSTSDVIQIVIKGPLDVIASRSQRQEI